MTLPILRAENIVIQRAGRTVLHIDHLELRRGETLALIGPNGSGKSTLLLALALLIQPSQGHLWFDQILVTPTTPRTPLRRRMAVVFQEPLLVDQSVFDNVALGLRLRGLRRADIGPRVQTWLDRLGIAHLARRPARHLSGGEAQRTSLARAFALQPDIMLLDEPFAALDAPTRATLLEQVSAIVRELGIATVFVTHDRDEALTLGDRLAVLIDGRLAQVGIPAAVFAAPADAAVARIVGVETLLRGQVIGSQGGVAQVRVGPQLIAATSSAHRASRVWVCLRPEDVTLMTQDDALRLNAPNQLAGTVERLRPSAGQFRVTIDCGFPLTALVSRRVVDTLALAPGRPVVATFPASVVHLIEND